MSTVGVPLCSPDGRAKLLLERGQLNGQCKGGGRGGEAPAAGTWGWGPGWGDLHSHPRQQPAMEPGGLPWGSLASAEPPWPTAPGPEREMDRASWELPGAALPYFIRGAGLFVVQGSPYLLLGHDLEGWCLLRAWEACGLLKAPSVPTCLPIS